MEFTMMSIGKYIEDNFANFGLSSKDDLRMLEMSNESIVDGGQWLIVLPLRTMPDTTKQTPFSGLLASNVRGDRYQTVLEIECKTRADNPSVDFYWNRARRFGDTVKKTLAGNGSGLLIDRYDFTDAYNPVKSGQILFEVSPEKSSPMEDEIVDQDDKANKSKMLTYNLRWWKPE